jgi:hypothetical protein
MLREKIAVAAVTFRKRPTRDTDDAFASNWVAIDSVETGFLAPECSARPFLGSRRIETVTGGFLHGRESTGK